MESGILQTGLRWDRGIVIGDELRQKQNNLSSLLKFVNSVSGVIRKSTLLIGL